MLRLISSVALVALVSASCARPATPPSPTAARQSASSGAQSLKAKKPAQTTQASQPPKALPAAKSAQGTTVTPKDITRGGTVTIETWSFTGVDLDGDGAGDDGVVAVAGDDVAAWWSGTFSQEDGSTVPYEAMLWTDQGGVGVIYDFGQSAIACGAESAGGGGCIVCDSSGACSMQ